MLVLELSLVSDSLLLQPSLIPRPLPSPVFLYLYTIWQIVGAAYHLANTIYHCKKGKVVLTQFGYLKLLLLVCIVKHSGVPLPVLQILNLIWLYKTLENVKGEYFADAIVQSCGKGYETEVNKMVKLPTFSYSAGVAKLGFKATISMCLYNRA